MGMFDSLFVSCRNCGQEVEFQSKAGDCSLASYRLDNVPPGIAGDLAGETEICQRCSSGITLRVQMLVTTDQ